MSFNTMKSYGSTPDGQEVPIPVPNAPRRFGDVVRVASLVGVLVFLGSYLFTLQTWTPTSSIEAVTTTTLSKSEVPALNIVKKAFVDGVQPQKLREFLHAYASVPHTCGTKQDYETALYTAEKWKSYGLEAVTSICGHIQNGPGLGTDYYPFHTYPLVHVNVLEAKPIYYAVHVYKQQFIQMSR